MDWVVFDNYCYLLGLPPSQHVFFQRGVRELCQGFVTLDSLCLGSKE